MRRKICPYIVIIALTACSTATDDIYPDKPQVPEDRTFSLATCVRSSAVVDITRSVPGPQELTYFKRGEDVGLYALKSEFTLQQGQKIVADKLWSSEGLQANFDNGHFQSKGPDGAGNCYLAPEEHKSISFPDGDNSALIMYGYYPWVTGGIVFDREEMSATNYPRIPVDIPANAADMYDYMYTGRFNAPYGEPEYVLPFEHALARLNILIKTNDPKLKGAGCPKVKKITVETTEYQSGMMNIGGDESELAEPGTRPGDIIRDGRNDNVTFYYEPANGGFNISSSNTGKACDTGAHFMFIPSGGNDVNRIILDVVMPGTSEIVSLEVYTNNPDTGRDNINLYKGMAYDLTIEYGVRPSIEYTVTNWTSSDSSWRFTLDDDDTLDPNKNLP